VKKLMVNLSWKKIIAASLGIFALFFGSVGLTGCELPEQGVEQEEQEGEEDD
jgi:hypothetical protein